MASIGGLLTAVTNYGRLELFDPAGAVLHMINLHVARWGLYGETPAEIEV